MARRPSQPSGALKRARVAVCIVRIVHSLFASTDEWDNQLEGTKSGFSGFLRTLVVYLTHFRGQRSTFTQFVAPVAGTEADAWETLTAALGVKGVSVGQRCTAPAGVPALSGVVEYITQNPYDALLRLDKPGPGVAALGTFMLPRRRLDHGGDELLPVRRSGRRNRRPLAPLWQAWFQERFPMPTELGKKE